jgi:prepilin-type N-terminal cleavage/methylation domain-containing protein
MKIVQNTKRPGFVLIELVTAIFIIGLMLAALAVSLDGYARFNDYLLTRQRCTASAQAQLDSIAVTGEMISDKDMQRLWPNIKISVERSEGVGQWKGLELVKVCADAKSRRKTVHLQLSRYISTGRER